VGTRLNYLPFVHHIDHIGVLYGGKAVGYYDGCPAKSSLVVNVINL
jgi:hypothetical protein